MQAASFQLSYSCDFLLVEDWLSLHFYSSPRLLSWLWV